MIRIAQSMVRMVDQASMTIVTVDTRFIRELDIVAKCPVIALAGSNPNC